MQRQHARPLIPRDGPPVDPLLVGRANVVYEKGEKASMPLL